jgi:multiple sugar transport system substrate-binding protein
MSGPIPGDFPATVSRRRILGVLATAALSGLTLAACGGSAAVPGTTSATAATTASAAAVTNSAAPAATTQAAASTAPTVAITAATTAAGKITASAAAATAAPAQGAQTLQWLMRTDPKENPWEEKQAIPGFATAQPGITVQLIAVPFAEVDPKLTAMIAGGVPPDVFSEFGALGFGDYYQRGVLAELTPLINRDHFDMGKFLPGVPQLYQRAGKYFHLPQVANFGEMIVYNKALFDNNGVPHPPASWNDTSWTWDAFMQAAQKLTRNPGQPTAQYGADLGTIRNIYMAAYLWGGDAWPTELYQTGLAQASQLTDPKVVAATQAVADAYFKQHVAPTAADAKSLSQVGGNIFITGKIAMTISLPTQAYGSFKTLPFQWGLAPLPRQASNKHSVFNGCWFIEKDSKHVEASWEFLKYLDSDKSAAEMGAATGFLVPLTSAVDPWLKLFEAPTGMTAADIRTVILDSNKNSVENVNHLFVDWTDINSTMNKATGAIWAGTTDAQTALTSAKGPVDALLSTTYGTYHK